MPWQVVEQGQEPGTDTGDGCSVSSGIMEQQMGEGLGLCQRGVGAVFCLSSVYLWALRLSPCFGNWGSIILFAALEQGVITEENPEILFSDPALRRERQKQHSCHLPIF